MNKLSFVRYLFLSVIILSVGCAGLGRENRLLSHRMETLGWSQGKMERAKSSLDGKLQGTGVIAEIRHGKIVVILPSSTYFNSGQTTLKKKARGNLTTVCNAIKTVFPHETIRVVGHTDNEPIRKTRGLYASNWELSAKRAASVLHFLVDQCNLDPRKLHIAGFGEYQPIASNNTKKGKKQNRRVELVILAAR